MSDAVQVEAFEGVLTIVIDRPHARNAIDGAAARGIADAIALLESSDDLHAAVLGGAGGFFSAGMDLKAFLAGEVVVLNDRGLAGFCEVPPAKPLVAAVEGWALAGGCEMALACDLIVAASDATFGIPEVQRGLVAGAGGLLRLPQVLPRNVARQLALTGDRVSAVDAHRFGMVNTLCEPGEALAEATALARRIAASAPLAVAATRRVLDEGADWRTDEAFTRQWEVIGPVFSSEDATEGARAFAEKRPPQWRGR